MSVKYQICPECRGLGYLDVNLNPVPLISRMPTDLRDYNQPCPACHRKGWVEVDSFEDSSKNLPKRRAGKFREA